jgi:orotidine-5'-phosphate decarboxylase
MMQAILPHVGVVKVGLSLFVEHGPKAVEAFQKLGCQVFLDLKLYDIPNTVRLACAQAAALGVSFLTVHASGGRAMLEAALEGTSRERVPPRILAVSVLTSMRADVLESVGISGTVEQQVLRLAELAHVSGVSGLVCSAWEARQLKASSLASLFLCTPGIRLPGDSAGDQQRIETPAHAIGAGSDLLVVGRPISESGEPVKVAQHIETEVARSQSQRKPVADSGN